VTLAQPPIRTHSILPVLLWQGLAISVWLYIFTALQPRSPPADRWPTLVVWAFIAAAFVVAVATLAAPKAAVILSLPLGLLCAAVVILHPWESAVTIVGVFTGSSARAGAGPARVLSALLVSRAPAHKH
jgi:hypothetical protein